MPLAIEAPSCDTVRSAARRELEIGADKAKDKQDRLIYDTDSGELRFDKDGKGKTKAVLIADGSPDVAHSDILVVA